MVNVSQPLWTPTSPWQSAPFRWLLIGRTANGLGSAIAPVAMALAVLRLGGSATDLGLVVAAYAVVDVSTTLVGGVLGDRFSRPRLMRGAAVLTCLAQLALALSLFTEVANVPMLAALSAVNGGLSAIAEPSSRAVVPQTVPTTALPTAVSALRLSQNTAMAMGFSLAGLLVALFGPGWAITVDAAIFAVAAGCFAAIKVEPTAAASAPSSLLNDLGAGAREVLRHTWLWVLLVYALVYHMVYGGIQGVLGPVWVTRQFGDAAWGLAMAALMIGFMVGGVITLRYRPDRLLLAGTGFVVLTACFPLAMALHLPLAIILVGAFLHGLGLEIFSVNWDLAIQQNVDPDKLTRVFAFDQVGSYVMRPLGLALTGPVAAVVGERSWLLIVAVAMTAATLLALLPPAVRDLRRRP